MKALIIVAALWFAATTNGQGTMDLVLNDGTTLKNVRVVAMGKTTVTIVSSAGVQSLGVDALSPDSLSKTKAAVAELEAARKEGSDAIVARETERTKEAKKLNDEIAKQRATTTAIKSTTNLDENLAPVRPFINSRAVVMDVQSVSKIQGKQYTAKRSTGEHDTKHERVTVLTVNFRCLGLGKPTPVDIAAKFISNDPLNRKLKVSSTAAERVFLGANSQTLDLVSEPLAQSTKYTTEGLTRFKTTEGEQPYGWIVTLSQDGRVVFVKESAQGLAAKFSDQ